jgi:predicted dehydrogenase/nucleoside-diphosphate-sugar epimerase
MRVGIIGCGGIAWVHAEAIAKQPGASIVGVVDLDADRAHALGSAFHVEGVYTDAATMLRETRPDVVHVLTPPRHHAAMGRLAIQEGCHVLVEKPLALTLAEAKELFDAAEQRGVRLCVNHNILYEDVFQHAIGLAKGGAVGQVTSVDARLAYDVRRNPEIVERGAENCHWSYRLNGGVLQDLMPHPASLIVEFLPEIVQVESVRSNRGKLPHPWHDEIKVLVASETVLGSISVSLTEHPDTIALTVRGTRGVLHADLFSNILTLQKRSNLPRAVARGLSGPQLTIQYFKASLKNFLKVATGRLGKADGMERLVRSFYGVVRNGGEAPVSREKTLAVAALLDALWPAPPVVPTTTAAGRARVATGRPPEALVTGGTGFIGIHLVERLIAEGVGVRVFVRPNSPHRGRLRDLPVEVVEGNLADAAAVHAATQGIRLVYHAGAAMGGPWEAHAKSTIAGTQHLIEASLTQGVERLVHLSTLAVYELASLPDPAIVQEGSPFQRRPERMGPYALAKIEAEKALAHAHETQGLPITIVRPGMVIGPMSPKTVFFPHLGFRVQDRLFLVVGKGDTILPLTYIDNTVDAIYRASLEPKAVGQSYNIVDDGEITVREYLARFIQTTGIPARIVHLPYAAPYLLALGLETAAAARLIKASPTSRAQLKQKHKSVRFNCTKARTELGWQQPVALEAGLTRTFEWYAARYG